MAGVLLNKQITNNFWQYSAKKKVFPYIRSTDYHGGLRYCWSMIPALNIYGQRKLGMLTVFPRFKFKWPLEDTVIASLKSEEEIKCLMEHTLERPRKKTTTIHRGKSQYTRNCSTLSCTKLALSICLTSHYAKVWHKTFLTSGTSYRAIAQTYLVAPKMP